MSGDLAWSGEQRNVVRRARRPASRRRAISSSTSRDLPDAGLAGEEHDLSAAGSRRGDGARPGARALPRDRRRASATARAAPGRRFAPDLHRAAAGRPQDHRVANEARGGRAEHDGPGGRLRQQPSRSDAPTPHPSPSARSSPVTIAIPVSTATCTVTAPKAEPAVASGIASRSSSAARTARRTSSSRATVSPNPAMIRSPAAGREAAAEALDDLRRPTADELGELVQVLRIDRAGGHVALDEAQRDRRHAAALGLRGDPRRRCNRRRPPRWPAARRARPPSAAQRGRRSEARSDGSWCRMRRSSSPSAADGTSPSSSSRVRRRSCNVASASAWRPPR